MNVGVVAPRIIDNSAVCWTTCSGWQQMKHQSLTLLTLVWEGYSSPDSLTKGQQCESVPCPDIIMNSCVNKAIHLLSWYGLHSETQPTHLTGENTATHKPNPWIYIGLLYNWSTQRLKWCTDVNSWVQIWLIQCKQHALTEIQYSAAITPSNITPYDIVLYTALSRMVQNLIRGWTHKGHPIPLPHVRAMENLLWRFWRKWTVL